MERIAYTMKLFPGQAEEYKRRHDALWPDVQAALREAGIKEYSIFLDPETNTLFATMLRPEINRVDDLPNHPAVKRWWAFMRAIMDSNPDNSPVTKPLVSMWQFD